MIKLMLISLAVVAVAFALLSIKVLLKRNGKFSSQHVHDNPGLRKQGIHCVIHLEQCRVVVVEVGAWLRMQTRWA